MRFVKFILCVCFSCVVWCSEFDKTLLNEWTYHINANNIKWPSLSTKTAYEETGKFVSPNVIATRLQIYKDQAIVLTPKFKEGVPFTLGKFSMNAENKCCSELEAYPSFQAHEDTNVDAIQNAVDMFLGPQDVLWVLDIGIVNTMQDPAVRGPPKVLAIDLKTATIIKTIDLSKLTCAISRLQYIVVEYAEDGRSFVYISDAGTRAIIVFDVASNRGYRVVLPEAVVADRAHQDVLYLALTKKSDGTAPALYFTYLSSDHLYYVDTSHLQFRKHDGTVVDVGVKPSRLVLLGFDGGTNLFFRYKNQSDVLLWNAETSFERDNFVVVQSGGDSRFATQVMVGYRKLMWVIESNFPDYIQGTTGCMGASVLLHPLVKTTP